MIFSSCSNLENEMTLNKNSDSSDSRIEKIGEVHNEGLSHIFERIKEEGTNGKAVFHKTAFITKEFVSEMYGKDPLVLKAINESVDFEMNRLNFQNGCKNRILEIQEEKTLSTECQKYLLEIYSNLEQIDTKQIEYFEEIEKIREESKNLSDEFEIFIIDSTIEILMASYQYWDKNVTEWVSHPNSKVNGKISVSGLVGADATGATLSAVNMAVNGTGAALIAIGPSGWVAAGAAVAAGGLMSSAGKAIWDLWTS